MPADKIKISFGWQPPTEKTSVLSARCLGHCTPQATARQLVPITRPMRHEQTILYQRCLELMQITAELIEQFPAGFAFLTEQLRKSSSSVARNYGEGYYQRSGAQQRKYFDIASHSARETSMSFDTAQCFRIGNSTTIARGKQVALQLVKMLSKFRHV